MILRCGYETLFAVVSQRIGKKFWALLLHEMHKVSGCSGQTEWNLVKCDSVSLVESFVHVHDRNATHRLFVQNG